MSSIPGIGNKIKLIINVSMEVSRYVTLLYALDATCVFFYAESRLRPRSAFE